MRCMKNVAVLALALVGLWLPVSSWADKSLRIIVAFPAGGAMDKMARAVAAELASTSTGKPVVENRPGADGLIALNHMLSHGDSSAAMLLVGPYFTTALANGKLPADKAARFKPVILLGDLDIYLIAHHRVAIKNLADLSNPVDKPWSCAASGGQFTTICDLLASDDSSKVISVPYRGEAQAFNDLLGGHIDFMPITGMFAAQHLAAGTVSLIANLSAPPSNRHGAPSSLVFRGPIKSFYGFVVTNDMPKSLASQLNQNINTIIKSQELDASARAVGLNLVGGSTSDLEGVMRDNLAVQSRFLGVAR